MARYIATYDVECSCRPSTTLSPRRFWPCGGTLTASLAIPFHGSTRLPEAQSQTNGAATNALSHLACATPSRKRQVLTIPSTSAGKAHSPPLSLGYTNPTERSFESSRGKASPPTKALSLSDVQSQRSRSASIEHVRDFAPNSQNSTRARRQRARQVFRDQNRASMDRRDRKLWSARHERSVNSPRPRRRHEN
jgi:hypothetical protein